MKANEAPESKFVYPEKLYTRCKDNKTLDISYAPQNMEAIEYIRADAFIDKACKWLDKNLIEYWEQTNEVPDIFIEDFRNHLKE